MKSHLSYECILLIPGGCEQAPMESHEGCCKCHWHNESMDCSDCLSVTSSVGQALLGPTKFLCEDFKTIILLHQ